MKRRLLRIALYGVALAFAGFLVAASGIIPLKASAGHWPITEWILRFGMKRSIATHSLTVKTPDLSDPALVVQGAGHYEIGCRSCHGEPKRVMPRVAARMLPPPPPLAERIVQSTPEKLFYVVKHGLKFTGMPAWPTPHRDDEVWAVVAFLLQFPQLDAAAYRRLVEGEPRGATPMQDMHASEQRPAAIMQSCARCHGADGLGRDGVFPRLAGQRREYLENALAAYATGKRHSGTMEPVSAALTSEMAREVARYYANLPGPRTSDTAPDAARIERGRVIAQEGIASQRVPACVECHGPRAKRGKAAYPSLAGQSANYLELQLTLFGEQRRGGAAYAHLMKPVATKLTPEQRKDVAAYFASLPAEERAAAYP